MRKKLTHEEVVQRVQHINANIKIIGKYVNATTKLKCKCLIDGYEWDVLSSNLFNGQGCPMCGLALNRQHQTKTHDTFVKEMENINPNIVIIGKYIGNHQHIECKCLKCNYIWSATPHNLLKGRRCPECAKISRAKLLRTTHEEFVVKLQNVNPYIKVIDKYYDSHTKIDCQCLSCNHIWSASPNNLLRGYGCPKCNESKGEKVISQILAKWHIAYMTQYKFDDCKHKRPLPFDFYLPKHNVCIEYDGRQHYEPTRFGNESAKQININFNNTKNHDNIKNQYCKENNIKLLRIPYWEFDNIAKILSTFLTECF